MEILLAAWCKHVAEGGAAIRHASREPRPAGSAWSFRCGARHAPEDFREVPLELVIRRDPSALEIVLHPAGTALVRAGPGGRWQTEDGPVLFPHHHSRRWPDLDPRYPPRPGELFESEDLAVLADVSERGWHTRVAAPWGARPAHAFSVGLFRSFDHPEIAIVGLDVDALTATVDELAARVQEGARFGHGDVAEGVIAGRLCAFRTIPMRAYPSWLGYAVWYHAGARFPALQLVWSDQEGRFPWEAWSSRESRETQPVLFEPELA
jgi:hypothetical protein